MAKRKQTAGERIVFPWVNRLDDVVEWHQWESLARRIDRAIRAAEKRGYERGVSEGYSEGHEDQMKMRVRDAMEAKARGGK